MHVSREVDRLGYMKQTFTNSVVLVSWTCLIESYLMTMDICVCVCVCVSARAHARVCACFHTVTSEQSHQLHSRSQF